MFDSKPLAFVDPELAKQRAIKSTLEEVEKVRKEAELALKKLLAPLGRDHAEDIAHYFFGPNPQVKELTEKLFQDLGVFKATK